MAILSRIVGKFRPSLPSLFAAAAGVAVSLSAAGLTASWESRHAAAQSAIGLAHEFNIEIVAEGVETEGQQKFLLSAGCAYGQGYRFSRPVSAAQATALLRLGTIRLKRKSLRLVESSAA